MKSFRDTITLQTGQSQEFVDITKHVRDVIARSEIRDGLVVVSSLHTTLGIFMNEFQGALLHDLGEVLQRLIPRRTGYRHDDPRYSDCDRGNAHAHLRATLLRPERVPGGGRPRAGDRAVREPRRAELDGPRARTIAVQVLGE